jgi:hypothetical protein
LLIACAELDIVSRQRGRIRRRAPNPTLEEGKGQSKGGQGAAMNIQHFNLTYFIISACSRVRGRRRAPNPTLEEGKGQSKGGQGAAVKIQHFNLTYFIISACSRV